MRDRCRNVLSAAALVAAAVLGCAAPSNQSTTPAATSAPVMPSWNDGPARSALTAFVTKVTTAGSPDFVAPADRIAVFDNDGTLWCEQPIYIQFQFALDRV